MHSPKLETLIQEPVTFLFGAGASRDYGFPLWSELRSEFLKRLSPDIHGSTYWLEALTDEKRAHLTLDQLTIDAMGKSKTLFQRIVSEVIMDCEAADMSSMKESWIEQFSLSLLELAKDHDLLTMIIQNVSFVSLNYDRCFDYRFGKSFVSKIPSVFPDDPWAIPAYTSTINSAKFNTIHHCHGVPGGMINHPWVDFKDCHVSGHTFLNRNKYTVIPYGDKTALEKRNWESGIISVDYAKKGQNTSYIHAHSQALNVAKNLIVIGLSTEGLSQSDIKINEKTKVYCNGPRPVRPLAKPIGDFAMDVIHNLTN